MGLSGYRPGAPEALRIAHGRRLLRACKRKRAYRHRTGIPLSRQRSLDDLATEVVKAAQRQKKTGRTHMEGTFPADLDALNTKQGRETINENAAKERYQTIRVPASEELKQRLDAATTATAKKKGFDTTSAYVRNTQKVSTSRVEFRPADAIEGSPGQWRLTQSGIDWVHRQHAAGHSPTASANMLSSGRDRPEMNELAHGMNKELARKVVNEAWPKPKT